MRRRPSARCRNSASAATTGSGSAGRLQRACTGARRTGGRGRSERKTNASAPLTRAARPGQNDFDCCERVPLSLRRCRQARGVPRRRRRQRRPRRRPAGAWRSARPRSRRAGRPARRPPALNPVPRRAASSACNVRPTAPTADDATSTPAAAETSRSTRSAIRRRSAARTGRRTSRSAAAARYVGPAPPRRCLLPTGIARLRAWRRAAARPVRANRASGGWTHRARAQPAHRVRVRFAGFDRLPVVVLVGERGQAEQGERGLAGVGVGAEDDEIVMTASRTAPRQCRGQRSEQVRRRGRRGRKCRTRGRARRHARRADRPHVEPACLHAAPRRATAPRVVAEHDRHDVAIPPAAATPVAASSAAEAVPRSCRAAGRRRRPAPSGACRATTGRTRPAAPS